MPTAEVWILSQRPLHRAKSVLGTTLPRPGHLKFQPFTRKVSAKICSYSTGTAETDGKNLVFFAQKHSVNQPSDWLDGLHWPSLFQLWLAQLSALISQRFLEKARAWSSTCMDFLCVWQSMCRCCTVGDVFLLLSFFRMLPCRLQEVRAWIKWTPVLIPCLSFEVIDQHMKVNAVTLSHPKAMFYPSPPQTAWKRSIGTSLFLAMSPMS